VRAAEEYKKEFEGFAPETLEWLRVQPWPGNVRELQHAVERAMILSTEPLLALHRFTGGTRPSTPVIAQAVAARNDGAVLLHSLNVRDAEAVLIDAALARTEGNRTHAAALLGISVRTLRTKLNAASPSQPTG
jgi:DNA-binding NtrC family response regulator